MGNIPSQLLGPETSGAMRAAMDEFFALGDIKSYSGVPLVLRAVRANMYGKNVVVSFLSLTGDPQTRELKLDSASANNETTEDLARVAYDLLDPLVARPGLQLDLGSILNMTLEAGYRNLTGVLTLEDAAKRKKFGSLIVPNIYKEDVYDFAENELTTNPSTKGLNREHASTALSATLLGWAIENSIQL